MSMQVTGPDGRVFSVASDNTVYDSSNNAIGHVDTSTGQYVGNDGASVSLADLASQGFVFPDGYVASNGSTVGSNTPTNDVLPNASDAGEPVAENSVVISVTFDETNGDMSRAHVAAEVIDALEDPTFKAANPDLAATVVANLETLKNTYSQNLAQLGPSIEQWIAIGQQILATGTRVEASASDTPKGLLESAVEQAQKLANRYFVPADPELAEKTAAELFMRAATFSGAPGEKEALEALIAKAEQLVAAGKHGDGAMKPVLPYDPALGAPIYMPVATMDDLFAYPAYRYASAADQARMREFVSKALSDSSAPNGLTDRWFNVQVSRPQDRASDGMTAEQRAEAEWLERIKRETPDPFDTGTAWIAVYLEKHPFDMEQAKRDAYAQLVRQANETYQYELNAWTRDQQLNGPSYAANGGSSWPKPTPPVLDENQLRLRAEIMANEQKQQRDQQIAAFYNQVGQEHAAQRETARQASEVAWRQLLDTEVARVQSEMSARGFTPIQITPYLDSVRQQFYSHPFEDDGTHPTSFTWLPPDYYAAMLERGNA